MDKETRKEQVLKCAQRIFSQKGYHSTTIDDIIKEAKIARGTFYLYFENKRAIFDELLDQLLGTIQMQISRVDLALNLTPLAQVEHNVEKVLEVLTSNKELIRIVLREAVGLDDAFDKKLTEFYQNILKLIQWSLQLGQTMGIIKTCDTKVASLCLLGCIKEVLDHHLVNPEEMPDNKQLSHEIVDLIANGIFINKFSN